MGLVTLLADLPTGTDPSPWWNERRVQSSRKVRLALTATPPDSGKLAGRAGWGERGCFPHSLLTEQDVALPAAIPAHHSEKTLPAAQLGSLAQTEAAQPRLEVVTPLVLVPPVFLPPKATAERTAKLREMPLVPNAHRGVTVASIPP
jgi:hypothetical protein